MSDSELTRDRQRRAISRSTILWSVAAVGMLILGAANWITLAVDGGGSQYTWGMAVGATVIAVFTVVFIVTFRVATRSLRLSKADRRR
ncbi:hypothetical protein [Microbacterium hydrocarbonoxydans]|uniref:hypothetical protein n=1 Tax=Microbacterium hydrocarbonoxydans TaxID=273678 RepID=UPI00203BD072|nr:hypothetical protein [Microbacterium hydrocarbonoxydans]MCM3778407.1 hypothetical protein [Microbacterium hydrocarbonoxydans]